MRQYDPNKRPPFSFTYGEIMGVTSLTIHKVDEARRLGWPTWEHWRKNSDNEDYLAGIYLVHECTCIADRALQPVIYSDEIKDKLRSARIARENFPLPGDPRYAHQEVAQ